MVWSQPNWVFIIINEMTSKNSISLKDVYDIAYRIESKLNGRLDSHERRISRTEEKIATVSGKASNTVVMVTMFISVGGLILALAAIAGS